MTSRTHTIVDVAATCACGSVTMRVTGPVLSMFMCSCLDCQRATGTGHSTAALVQLGALSITGEIKGFGSPSDSGAVFTRHFCPVCGNPLFGASSRAPDVRMVSVGFFAGHNDWFAPNQLIFARSHRQWDMIADELPRHQTYRDKRVS